MSEELKSELNTLNPHLRDSRITFDEPTHTYTIDGSSDKVMSVTTMIHSYFPHFNANETIKKMRLKGMPEKYKDMTDDEIKKLWNDNGKESSSNGTQLHKSIELFYNGDIDYIYNDVIPKEFNHFLKFNESIKNRLKPYRTEWSIFRKDLFLAGQLDMLYEIIDKPGEFALYDWKRSKEIKFENKFEKGFDGLKHLENCNYIHYSIQLNIYKRILETLYNINVKEMTLVILHPDNDTFIIINVYEMSKEIDFLFKDRKKKINQ